MFHIVKDLVRTFRNVPNLHIEYKLPYQDIHLVKRGIPHDEAFVEREGYGTKIYTMNVFY